MKPCDVTTLKAAALALTLFGTAAAASPAAEKPPKTSEERSRAVALIDDVLGTPADAADAADFASLRETAAKVLKLADQNHVVKSTLSTALSTAEGQEEASAAKQLRKALAEARDTLGFEVLAEAPLPQGFPEGAPVGEIRVQEYPAYRLARTKMTNGDSSAFMTLFRHISTNQIAMTAPVEMRYRESEAEPEARAQDMAFLYANTEIGRAGDAGDVEVVDVPGMTVVSIGMRGDITGDTIEAAQSHLESWLADHADKYEADGDLRVFGYNSPMVPAGKRYFEVQVPVRAKKQ